MTNIFTISFHSDFNDEMLHGFYNQLIESDPSFGQDFGTFKEMIDMTSVHVQIDYEYDLETGGTMLVGMDTE